MHHVSEVTVPWGSGAAATGDEEWSRNVDASGSRNIRVLRGERPVGDEAADEPCGCDDTRKWQ